MSEQKGLALLLLDGIYTMLLAANSKYGSITDAHRLSREAIVAFDDKGKKRCKECEDCIRAFTENKHGELA